jgi:hypothetical protein
MAGAFARGILRFGGPLGFLLGMTTTANEGEAERPWDPVTNPGGKKGAGAVTSPHGAVADRLTTGVQMLMGAGYSREASIGIMSGLYYESDRSLSPTAFNPAGGGRGAQGIAQLRGDRIDEASKFLGKPWASASYDEQMQYVIWSMQNGGDFGARRAGQMLRAPGISAGQASDTFLSMFERPGSGGAAELGSARSLADELSRSLPREGGGDGDKTVHVTQKNEINFHGEPHRYPTSDDVRAALRESNQELVRNTAGAVR